MGELIQLPRAGDRPARRPVAHVLTILDFTQDGPTYTLECREPAKDLGKACAVWIPCECDKGERDTVDEDAACPASPTGRHELFDGLAWRPAHGCLYAHADAEDTDDAVRELVSRHRLTRGVYFIQFVRPDEADPCSDEFELELLAEMRTMVGCLGGGPEFTVRPTDAPRYPGHGPEVEVRELIEESLSEEPHAVIWDNEGATIVVDAQVAARKVVAWVEKAYDVPPDQLSFATLPPRPKSAGFTAPRIATVSTREDML